MSNAITTRGQFTAQIKSLGAQGAKIRETVQELLIAAVYYAESDGDVAPILRVVDAIKDTKSIDLWKVHAWLKKYEAPVKPSEDGASYVFDAKKRHLSQGASRDMFAPYEMTMRQEPKWYELKKADPKPADVWAAETGFENFIKKLDKEGFGEASEAVKALVSKLKSEGKLRRLVETLEDAPL